MADFDFGYKAKVKYPVRNFTKTFVKECELEFVLRGKFEITDNAAFKGIEAEKEHLKFLSDNIGKFIEASLHMICGEIMPMDMYYGLSKTLPDAIIQSTKGPLEKYGVAIATVIPVLYRMSETDEQELQAHDDLNAMSLQTSGEGGNKKYKLMLPRQVHGGPKLEEHYPGETIVVSVAFVTDVDTIVTATGTNIRLRNTDGGSRNYEFVMPAHDVMVEVNYSGGMVCPPNIGSMPMGMTSMGMAGMAPMGQGGMSSMMGMMQSGMSEYVGEPWDCVCGQKGNKSKFCPNCGFKRS